MTKLNFNVRRSDISESGKVLTKKNRVTDKESRRNQLEGLLNHFELERLC